MTYWLSMGTVLLLGYALIRWSGRANEQANDGDTGIAGTYSAGFVDTRSDTRVNATPEANNYGSNQGYNGGEA
jgi:hypothetical protein